MGEYTEHEGNLDASGMRVAVVASRFNDDVTKLLLDGALRELADMGLDPESVPVVWVPGAFEIPVAAKQCAASGSFDAVITLGAVIRGDTAHFDFVAGECARGIQDVQLTTGVPVAFGVLATEDHDQALARSEGPGGHNVGEEAAVVAAEMALVARRFPPALR